MARNFRTAFDEYIHTGSNLGIDLPFCGACWYRPLTAAASTRAIISIEQTSNNSFYQLLQTSGTAVRAAHGTGTSFAASTGGSTLNVWNHAAFSFDSTASRSVWINGGNKGTNTESKAAQTITDVMIGRTIPATWIESFDGDVALVTLWSGSMTDAEALALSKGRYPIKIRGSGIIEHWDLTRRLVGLRGNNLLIGAGSSIVRNPPKIFGFSGPIAAQKMAGELSVVTNDLTNAQTISQPSVTEPPAVVADIAHATHLLQSPSIALGSDSLFVLDDLVHGHSLSQPAVYTDLFIQPSSVFNEQYTEGVVLLNPGFYDRKDGGVRNIILSRPKIFPIRPKRTSFIPGVPPPPGEPQIPPNPPDPPPVQIAQVSNLVQVNDLASCNVTKQIIQTNVRFVPGHYFKVIDDPSRGINGVTDGNALLNRNDIGNFRGCYFYVNWKVLEPTQGNYNFSTIQSLLNTCVAKNKYMLVVIRWMSFHTTDCNQVLPSYIEKYVRADGTSCSAKAFINSTADAFTDLCAAFAAVYNDHPNIVGVSAMEESAPGNPGGIGWTAAGHSTQLTRFYTGMKRSLTKMPCLIGINWPQTNAFMRPVFEHIASIGGGGVTWPDSIPAQSTNYLHYNLAREFQPLITIMPQAQQTQIEETETEAVYQLLVNDIKVHQICWDTWHHTVTTNYFPNYVIPTVDAHNGFIRGDVPSTLDTLNLPPIPSPPQTRWEPMHCIKYNDDPFRGIDCLSSGEMPALFARTDIAHIKGVQVYFNWKVIEPTLGNFDFSRITQVINYVASKNRKIHLEIRHASYHTTNIQNIVPVGVDGYNAGDGSCRIKIWQTATANQLIAMLAALGAAFNDNPNVLSIAPIGEVGAGPNGVAQGWTQSGVQTQVIRVMQETKPYWPNCVCLCTLNFPNNTGWIDPIVAAIKSIGGCGITWPDTIPDAYSEVGPRENTLLVYDIGRNDWDDIAIFPFAQQTGIAGGQPCQEAIYQMLQNDIHAHTIWWDKWHHTTGNTHLTHVLNVINNHNGFITQPGKPSTIP